MHVTRPLISLFATACLAACTAGTSAPTTGSAGTGGSSPAGAAGTVGSAGAIGRGGMSGSGPGGFAFDGGSDGPATCGLQNFQINLEPPEILVVLDRSVTMGRNSRRR